MRNALYGVFLTVGKVIGGVNHPLITCLVMVRTPYAIQDWIAQINVRRRHVDTGSQNPTAVFELPCSHALKQIPVLCN